MVTEGHIAKVERPTEWVSSMVVALRNGKIRICIDPKDLNKCTKREHYLMRTVQEVLAQIPGAKVFSVLDTRRGFMQIHLDEQSSFLTTFNTPSPLRIEVLTGDIPANYGPDARRDSMGNSGNG